MRARRLVCGDTYYKVGGPFDPAGALYLSS